MIEISCPRATVNVEGLCGFAAGEAEGRLEGEEEGGASVADALGQIRIEVKRDNGSGGGFAWTDYVGGRDEEFVSCACQAEDAPASPAVVLPTGEGSEWRSAAPTAYGFHIVDPSPVWW